MFQLYKIPSHSAGEDDFDNLQAKTKCMAEVNSTPVTFHLLLLHFANLPSLSSLFFPPPLVAVRELMAGAEAGRGGEGPDWSARSTCV